MAPNTQNPYRIYTLMHSSTCLLRFVLLLPAAFYWVDAGINHRLVRDHVLLHNGTYDVAIVTGERLANQWSGIVLLWDCVIWVPTIMLPPPLQLPIALGDTVLTGYLSRTTAYQSGYVPKDLKACRDMSTFYNQPPIGTNESFFAAAARLNATPTTPTKICEMFVQEWQYGVALSFFYALMSLFGIIAVIGCRHLALKRFLSLCEVVKWIALGSGKCAIYSIVFLCSIPAFIFRCCLPIKAQAPVRTARRYAMKAVFGVEQKTEFALNELKTELANKNKTIERYKGTQGESTPLARFLGVYDMLMTVVPYLHYIDAVNLASVSKSVRISVLPPDDLYRRLALFKRLSCLDTHRAPCWVCSNQTCIDCRKLAVVTPTVAIYHLENCKPYCMLCYYQHVALKKPMSWEKLKNTACKCAPVSAHSSIINNYIWSRKPVSRRARVPVSGNRPLCRTCSTLTAEEMTSRKNESGKFMLRKGRKSDGQQWDTCAKEGCENRLGTAPRFWVCPKCRRECRSNLHQAWGADSKGAEEVV